MKRFRVLVPFLLADLTEGEPESPAEYDRHALNFVVEADDEVGVVRIVARMLAGDDAHFEALRPKESLQ